MTRCTARKEAKTCRSAHGLSASSYFICSGLRRTHGPRQRGTGEVLVSAINDLLALKRETPELGLSPQIAPIQKFIQAELERLEHISPVRQDRPVAEPLLLELFRDVLKETWG